MECWSILKGLRAMHVYYPQNISDNNIIIMKVNEGIASLKRRGSLINDSLDYEHNSDNWR